MKGVRRKVKNRKTGQGYQGYQAGPLIQPYKPYQLASKDTICKRPYPNKFQSHSKKNNPGRSKPTLPTPRTGRAAANRVTKVHAATTKGMLKISTRTTTNACKPIT